MALVLAGSLVACLPNPATGVASNGGPLRMQYSTGTGTYVSNDKTGEDVHNYSDGSQEVTEHFEEKEHAYQWSDWRYFQGKAELDEQDYYRIANDPEAVQQIAVIRASAKRKMQIGLPIAIVGLVATAVLAGSGGSSSSYGTLGASAVAATGGLVWYWGERDMTKRHHLSQDRANEHADLIEECNEGHCTSARGGHRASR